MVTNKLSQELNYDDRSVKDDYELWCRNDNDYRDNDDDNKSSVNINNLMIKKVIVMM